MVASSVCGSGLENGHDLERIRIDHHDLVADPNELISAPFGIDRHDFRRKRMERDVAGHAGADRDREVGIGKRCNMLFAEHAGDLGALFGRKLRTGAGLSNRLALRAVAAFAAFGLHVAAVFTALGLHVAAVLTTLGLHVAAVFAAFRLLAIAIFAAFGLHLLAALGLVIFRAHGLRPLALRGVLLR